MATCTDKVNKEASAVMASAEGSTSHTVEALAHSGSSAASTILNDQRSAAGYTHQRRLKVTPAATCRT